MKKRWKIIGMVVLGLVGLCLLVNLGFKLSGGHFSINLPVRHRNEFGAEGMSTFPGRLQARGDQVVDANGNAVVLKGRMPPDPVKLRQEAYNSGWRCTGDVEHYTQEERWHLQSKIRCA